MKTFKNMMWFFMVTAGFAVQAGYGPPSGVVGSGTGADTAGGSADTGGGGTADRDTADVSMTPPRVHVPPTPVALPDRNADVIVVPPRAVPLLPVASGCEPAEPTEDDFPIIGGWQHGTGYYSPPGRIRRHIRNLVRNEGAFDRHMPQLTGFLQGYIGRDGVQNLNRRSRRLLARQMWALNSRMTGANEKGSPCFRPNPQAGDGIPPSRGGGCNRHKSAVHQLLHFSQNVRSLEGVLGKERVSRLMQSDRDLSSLLSDNYDLDNHRTYGVMKEFLGEQAARETLVRLSNEDFPLLNDISDRDLETVLDTLQARYGKQRVITQLKAFPDRFLEPSNHQKLLDIFKRAYPDVRPLVMAARPCPSPPSIAVMPEYIDEQQPTRQRSANQRGSAGQ